MVSVEHAPTPLPHEGFIRLPQVLKFIPVSKSTWWQGVQDGIYPAPVKLSKRTSAWKVEDIRALIKELGGGEA